MKKLLLTLIVLSSTAYANNIPKAFDTRPILPMVQEMRTMDWTWATVAKLPTISKLEKDAVYPQYFSRSLTISEDNPNTTVTFYGTKQAPEVAVIEARTWGAGNTQETLFPRLDMLKGNIPLKSNCNFKNLDISEKVKDKEAGDYETGASLTFQQAYILPKNIASLANVGKRDLYVASLQSETYVITSVFQTQAYTMSIITPNKAKLGKFINDFGWQTNKQDKKVKCTIQ